MQRRTHLLWMSLVVALAACGGGDDSGDPGGTPTGPQTPEPPPPPPPAAVASVSITPGSASLMVGRTTQLTATPRDAAGAALTRTVTWSSSASAIATVSASGLVTAVAPGEARISATSESVSASITVTVSPVPVASVTLSTLSELVPRASQTLMVTVQDSAGGALTGRTITWASANTAVATVNDSGVVTAVATGTTQISATVEGRSASANAVVRDGGFITPAGGMVTAANGAFSLSVPAQAVSANVALVVDGLSGPPAHARLLAGSAYRMTPAATTFAQPAALTITYASLPAGMRARQLRVHRWDGSAWQALSSTVDTTARRITSSVNAAGDFALIEVPLAVASVVITPNTGSLSIGDSLQLEASVRAADGEVLTDRMVTWTSSSAGTATVSSTGLVRAVAAGTTTITATSEGQSANVQVNVAAPMRFASVALGAFHSCGLTDDGEAWCWGESENCETGVQPCIPVRASPVRVNTTTRFVSIHPSNRYTCALTAAGAVWCWGLNASGNLGGPDYGVRPVPAPISGGVTFTSISAGARHVCGIDTDAKIWCWGLNGQGQLGIGLATAESTSPVRVESSFAFKQVSAGSAHTCALTTEAVPWCWGENSDGEAGTGTGVDTDRPEIVSGNHTFTSLVTGEYHSCGLKADGTLWCWGWNFKGQLGDGSDASRLVPVQIPSADRFTQVYPFGWSTCALTTTGQARCWGENTEGQAGSEGAATIYAPTPVSGSHTFRELAPGGLAYHMCGLTTTDAWYCWGWNIAGQLGDGTRTDRKVPTPLLNPTAAAHAMSRTTSPVQEGHRTVNSTVNSSGPRKVPPKRK